MEEFRKLGITDPIIKTLEEAKFEKPTEIQEKTIPLVLAGKDVIAGSATGSGKTLAFGTGIIQNLERKKGVQALIMTPTRELAIQVSQAMKQFSRYNPLDIAIVYGGVSINPQIDKLRKADIVVGTPGRILDHLQRRTISFKGVKVLVLDEADRMLDMGFIDDVERIIRECPAERQTLLFSATISTDINSLCHRYMKNPIKIAATAFVDPHKLTQVYYNVDDKLKFSLLVHLLKKEKTGLAMVFCNTRKNTDFVGKNLRPHGIKALAIHGGFSQQKRTRTMDDFHAQNVDVLVCTDVAARGLDIKGVSHVYNYDIPKDSKEYIHRIGRTARAGNEGKVINILASRDYDNFSRVEKEYHINIAKEEMPNIERVEIKWKEQPRFGRQHGGFRGGGFRGGGSREGGRGFRGRGNQSFRGHSSRQQSGQGLSRSERRERGSSQ